MPYILYMDAVINVFQKYVCATKFRGLCCILSNVSSLVEFPRNRCRSNQLCVSVRALLFRSRGKTVQREISVPLKCDSIVHYDDRSACEWHWCIRKRISYALALKAITNRFCFWKCVMHSENSRTFYLFKLSEIWNSKRFRRACMHIFVWCARCNIRSIQFSKCGCASVFDEQFVKNEQKTHSEWVKERILLCV